MQLLQKKQQEGQSPLAYYYEALALCKQVDDHMEEEKIIFHIKKGLSDDVYRMLTLQEISTVEGLREALRRVSEAEDRKREPVNKRGPECDILHAAAVPTKTPTAAVGSTGSRREETRGGFPEECVPKGNTEHQIVLMAEMGSRVDELEGAIRGLHLSEWDEPSDTRAAFYGPEDRNIPVPSSNGLPAVPLRRNALSGPDIICLHCLQRGHISRNCPQRGFRGDGNNPGAYGQGGQNRGAANLATYNPYRGNYRFPERRVLSAQGGGRGNGRSQQSSFGQPGKAHLEFVWNERAFPSHFCRICQSDHPLNRCPYRVQSPLQGQDSKNGGGRDNAGNFGMRPFPARR